jgi:hypothetical protein
MMRSQKIKSEDSSKIWPGLLHCSTNESGDRRQIEQAAALPPVI